MTGRMAGVASLGSAVLFGVPLTWLVIGAPLLLVVAGLVAFAGTRLLVRKHGLDAPAV